MSHTPRPWIVWQYREGAPLFVCANDMTLPNAICTVYGTGPTFVAANANLIAAAPDLLACVEIWIEQMRMEMAPTYSAQFRIASAAIAKAKGCVS